MLDIEHMISYFSSFSIITAAVTAVIPLGLVAPSQAETASLQPKASPVAHEPKSPLLAEATANKARMKMRPYMRSEPEYIRPKAAIAAGEFGEVLVTGIVGEDGKLYEPVIKTSSRSDILDKTALAEASAYEFSAALDGAGKAIKVPIVISMEYGHVDFNGPNSLAKYGCSQAVKDYDWWERAWGDEKQDRIYLTVQGMVATAALRSGTAAPTSFASEWKSAIEACRQEPSKRFLDLLKPHGALIRDMIKR